MTIKFDIHNRATGAILFTAEIECAENERTSIKLGLTVRWALRSGADLSGADLSGADLSGADLSGANLSGANLYRADLYRADLSRANLSRANLSGADLSGANLDRANLYSANLYSANLYSANLSGAHLSRANLSGANLSGANLSGANLYGVKTNRLLASAGRVQDSYTFHLYEMAEGPAKIVAGCRFLTIANYRAHVASAYPGTPKAAETLAILDYFEAMERVFSKAPAAKHGTAA